MVSQTEMDNTLVIQNKFDKLKTLVEEFELQLYFARDEAVSELEQQVRALNVLVDEIREIFSDPKFNSDKDKQIKDLLDVIKLEVIFANAETKNKLIENIEEIEELIHLVDELINSDDHKSDKISSLSEDYSVKLAKISYLLDLLKLQHLSDKSDLKEYILEHNKYIIEKLDKIKNSLHLNNGHFIKIFKEEVSSIFHYLHKNK